MTNKTHGNDLRKCKAEQGLATEQGLAIEQGFATEQGLATEQGFATDQGLATKSFEDNGNLDRETQEMYRHNDKESLNGDVQSVGDKDEPFGKQDEPFGKQDEPFGKQDEPFDCPDIVTDQSDDQSADGELIGIHELQVSEGDEADLQKYFMGCTKNPGHKEFIPVDAFSLKHLPEGHRDTDLYELIKAIADLTVRVDVRMTSPNRPKVWPNTKFPYPFYDMRKSTKFKSGTGRMCDVRMFTDGVCISDHTPRANSTKCWCKNCECSDSPSNVWWEFDLHSATHVVFDEVEASRTTLKLFYDREDSLVVAVDKVSVDFVNVEHDCCKLNCVTCDKNLGIKLDEIWKRYWDILWKVWGKYADSRDVVKLAFIVSHPHGCSKQISVGHWKDKYQLDGSNHKFTYTTCTCPGSSGAKVYCVGYNTGGSLCTDLVHSGSLKSGLNLSAAGRAY